MSCKILAGVLVLAAATSAQPSVVIELVPDNPGPYVVGEALTVDVWLRSEVAFDAFLFEVQFDFSDSDPALSLDATFTFDLSAIETPRSGDYATLPELPVPVVWVPHDGPIFPENMLALPAGGALHIGSIGLQLPGDPGVYRLDALNRDESNTELGAEIDALFFPGGEFWRAFTGEITGGTFDFVVGDPPIPTVSEWGLIVMTLLLVVVGSLTIMRRSRSTTRSTLVTALLTLSLMQSSAIAQDAGGGVALNVGQTNGRFELSLDDAPPFRVTQGQVTNARLVDVANSTVRVALWEELTASGQTIPFYGVSLDGLNMNRVTSTSYDLRLRFAHFDPTVAAPAVPASLTSLQIKGILRQLPNGRFTRRG